MDSDVSGLTDRELDRELATVAGARLWTSERGGYTFAVWQMPGEREPWKHSRDDKSEKYTEISWRDLDPRHHIESKNLPEYSRSIDALSAVEAKIASAGTGWGLYVHLGYAAHAEWSNGWVGHPWVRVETSAPTEARARAEAALLALRAIEPTSITTLASRGE